MKILLIVGVVLVVIVVAVLVAGSLLPVRHVTSRSATFAVPPEAVWRAITEVEAFPAWRSDVTRVERLPDRAGRAVWVEEGSNGRITFATERSEPPRVLITRIADPRLPFGGDWTYEITPTSSGSTLTITEHGEIYNPVFRLMARVVFGYDGTLTAYLASLQKKLQQEG
jgi:uncharacterized protein YndB with AHSA1/START domain